MYDWIRGSDFSFGIRVKSGTLIGTEVVRCVLKKSTVDHRPPEASEEEVIVFGVAFRPLVPAIGNVKEVAAHWLFSATAAQSERLASGMYIADAKIMIGTATIQTACVLINVVRQVTVKRIT